MIVLPIVTTFLCLLSVCVFFVDRKDNRETNDNNLLKEKNLIPKSFIIYLAVMIVITIAMSVAFCYMYKDANLWSKIKKLSLLAIVWPIAYIDFKTYRIPNIFILYGLVVRVVILGFELLLDSNFTWMTVLSELIAAGALFLGALLCSLCMKNAIGYGDIKLLIVMGLMLGLSSMWSAIFVSLILSFFLALFLLIFKKKSRKDTIPFAPTIVLGTYLSIFFNGV